MEVRQRTPRNYFRKICRFTMSLCVQFPVSIYVCSVPVDFVLAKWCRAHEKFKGINKLTETGNLQKSDHHTRSFQKPIKYFKWKPLKFMFWWRTRDWLIGPTLNFIGTILGATESFSRKKYFDISSRSWDLLKFNLKSKNLIKTIQNTAYLSFFPVSEPRRAKGFFILR